jgi:hypothetical protein
MRLTKIILPLALLIPLFLTGQRLKQTYQYVDVSGFVVDSISGAPLSEATVVVYDDMLILPLAFVETDAEGFYSAQVPRVERYKIHADKGTFFSNEKIVALESVQKKVKLKLDRKPGYVFDITIFDKAFEHNTINTLRDCKVEIYNNTTKEQVLTIEEVAQVHVQLSPLPKATTTPCWCASRATSTAAWKCTSTSTAVSCVSTVWA